MEADLEKRVVAAIADQTGCPVSQLSAETDLYEDLSINGDDAHMLLLRLGNEFGINLEKIRFNRHFGSEPHLFNPLALWPWLWPWRRERIPVMISDLVEAARTRTWPIGYDDEPRAAWTRGSAA